MYENNIRSLAGIVRNTFNMKIPMNVENLISKMGGEAIFDNVDCVHINKNRDRFKIIIPNKEYSFVDLNSLLAHSLGHLYLHMGYLSSKKKSYLYKDSAYYRLGINIENYQADLFAGELMIPKKDLLNKCKKYTIYNYVDVKGLANELLVTEGLLIARGRMLGIFHNI